MLQICSPLTFREIKSFSSTGSKGGPVQSSKENKYNNNLTKIHPGFFGVIFVNGEKQENLVVLVQSMMVPNTQKLGFAA